MRLLFAGNGLFYRMPDNLGTIIWTLCYSAVLLGISLYGLHRYLIVYLFLKNRRNAPVLQEEIDDEIAMQAVQGDSQQYGGVAKRPNDCSQIVGHAVDKGRFRQKEGRMMEA